LLRYKGTAIQDFYRDANVLITGGTGFMGKVLVEKLLRSCPHLRNIYLLVRKKKGKDVNTRIQEVFEDPVSANWLLFNV
jgi:fatty acyl-CoA reductase